MSTQQIAASVNVQVTLKVSSGSLTRRSNPEAVETTLPTETNETNDGSEQPLIQLI